MRRAKRKMSDEDARALLEQGTWGILSTAAADGLPYGVPLNYVYLPEENALYFHCANIGRKLDNLKENPRVSFAVVGRAEVIAHHFTTYYESVLVQGRASIIADPKEKAQYILELCRALAPQETKDRDELICRQLSAVTLVRIEADEISGKRNQGD